MKSLETIDFGIYSVAKKENLFGSDTLSVEYFDFSKANLSEQHRIHAISAVASVCYQNPKALNSASLYNRLMAESIGLPSSSFEFVPVLLDPMREPAATILANVNSNVRKFGEWIKAINVRGNKQNFLLTNYRALVYDCEDRCRNFEIVNSVEVIEDIKNTYLNWFNSEHDCEIIKKHFKVFKYNVDIPTRAQMVRHRVSWQELSRRYVNGIRVPFDFYLSEKMLNLEPKESYINSESLVCYEDVIEECVRFYYYALDQGVKPEEARRIIPQGMQTIIWGAFQPRQLDNFLKLRLDSHSQLEIRKVAEAMKSLII